VTDSSGSSPTSLQPRSSSAVSSTSSSAVAEVVRILVCGGGAVALTYAGLVPPHYGLLALIAIALPTHAGRLIDVIRGDRR